MIAKPVCNFTFPCTLLVSRLVSWRRPRHFVILSHSHPECQYALPIVWNNSLLCSKIMNTKCHFFSISTQPPCRNKVTNCLKNYHARPLLWFLKFSCTYSKLKIEIPMHMLSLSFLMCNFSLMRLTLIDPGVKQILIAKHATYRHFWMNLKSGGSDQ